MLPLNQRGNSLIETVLIAPVLGMCIAGSAVMIYLAHAKIWMSRSAREAAVCLASPSPPSRCRGRLESTIRIGLPIGATEIREFQSSRTQTRVSLRLSFNRSDAQDMPDLRTTAVYRRTKYFPTGE